MKKKPLLTKSGFYLTEIEKDIFDYREFIIKGDAFYAKNGQKIENASSVMSAVDKIDFIYDKRGIK